MDGSADLRMNELVNELVCACFQLDQAEFMLFGPDREGTEENKDCPLPINQAKCGRVFKGEMIRY